MQFLTICAFVLASIVLMANADSTDSFRCKDKYCFITTNSENERVLNCTTEKVEDDFIKCLYFRNNFKVMLMTKNDSYVKVDKIAPGAFQRLSSDMIMKKLFIKKIIFPQLDGKDFEGLTKITDIYLENPKVLAQDTFLKLASRRDTFMLQISCNDENRNVSFNELHFRNVYWILHTYGCKNRVICETSLCNASNEYPLYRLISTNQTSSQQFRLGYSQCKETKYCLEKEKERKNSQSTVSQNPTARSTEVTSSPISKSAKLVTGSKTETYYDTLMWVVLWLTGINSIVIMGILVFLIIWLKRMSSSGASKKHTIILEDEDNTKYLKLTPYA